jgi:excisionase family DNA binding protein
MYDLTPSEAAERLGVPKATLVTWLAELPVPHVTYDGDRMRLDEEALEVLAAIKGMRAYDFGYQTIRRHLAETEEEAVGPAPATAPASDAPAPAAPEVEAVAADPAAEEPMSAGPSVEAPDAVFHAAPVSVADLVAAVTTALEPRFHSLAELGDGRSRELARLAHQLGKLEADNEHLRLDRERLVAELIAARATIARLEGPPEDPFARPWWRFWGR